VKDSPAAVDSHHAIRGPLLLVSGTADHTVPRSVTEAVFRLYADNPSLTEYTELDGRGHSLTIDAGWRDVAELTLDWIAAQEPALVSAATG
jgi:pimeloyl-ACP methyl ester carboxylesterase